MATRKRARKPSVAKRRVATRNFSPDQRALVRKRAWATLHPGEAEIIRSGSETARLYLALVQHPRQAERILRRIDGANFIRSDLEQAKPPAHVEPVKWERSREAALLAEYATRAWDRRSEWQDDPTERAALLDLALEDGIHRDRERHRQALLQSRNESDRNLRKGALAAARTRTRRAAKRVQHETPASSARQERARRDNELRAYAISYRRDYPNHSRNACVQSAISKFHPEDPVTREDLSLKQVHRIIASAWRKAAPSELRRF